MKLALMSDVHLEFGPLGFDDQPDADVLILSGDICVAKDMDFPEGEKAQGFMNFFKQASDKYKDVIYVMGNHEHYHGDFKYSADYLYKALEEFPNIHLLDIGMKKIGDVTFIGGTLWTDMNKEDPITLLHMKGMMNDFRIVKNSNRIVSQKVPIYKKDAEGNFVYKNVDNVTSAVIDHYEHHEKAAQFSPEDAVVEHKKMLEYIRVMIEGKFDEKFVVVGHHSPCKQSTKPQYERDTIMNGGYSSNLNDFIIDHPQIKLWTHGHTHDVFDYMIGSTRVACNPRGYVYYERDSQKEDPFYAAVFEV